MEFLYHGSTTPGIKILEPRKRFTPSEGIEFSAIYATSLPIIGAVHSFPWTSDEGIDFGMGDGKVTLTVPKALKDGLEQPISIYKVLAKNFQHTTEEETGYTWHATEPIVVLEEKKYANVIEAFRELGGAIRFL
jgi:hypothetical protein